MKNTYRTVSCLETDKCVSTFILSWWIYREYWEKVKVTSIYAYELHLHGEVLVSQGQHYKRGFLENSPRVSPMSDRASFAWLQNRSTTGQNEPFSNAGSTSLITYWRHSKNAVRDRGVRKYAREATLQTSRSVQKEGTEVLRGSEQGFPCNLWRSCLQGKLFHGGAQWNRHRPCSPSRTTCHSTGYSLKDTAAEGDSTVEHPPSRSCSLLTGPGLLQHLWPCGWPMLEQFVPEGLHPMGRDPTRAILELQPMGRTHTEAVHEGLSPVGGSPCWSRGTAREGRTNKDKLLQTPQPAIHIVLWHLGKGRKR